MRQLVSTLLLISMLVLHSCQVLPLLTSPEALLIEEEIVEEIIEDLNL